MKKRAGLLGLAILASAARAAADGAGDVRLAQALFDEGRTLMEQRRFAEACPKLLESQRLDPGGGTLLNLAACHAGEGKTATALTEYQEALAVATRDGRKDREAIARNNIAQLDRDVPRVTVLVPHPTPGIEVKLDTTRLAPAAWGVATPVDPGAHLVTSSAEGYATVTLKLDVKPGERKVVDLPAATKAAPVPPAASATPTQEPRAAPSIYVAPEKTRANPLFWIGLGMGLGGLVTSVVTGGLAAADVLETNDSCYEARSFCRDQAARDTLAEARTLAWVSTVALGVSAVGFILTLALPSRKPVTTGASPLTWRF